MSDITSSPLFAVWCQLHPSLLGPADSKFAQESIELYLQSVDLIQRAYVPAKQAHDKIVAARRLLLDAVEGYRSYDRLKRQMPEGLSPKLVHEFTVTRSAYMLGIVIRAFEDECGYTGFPADYTDPLAFKNTEQRYELREAVVDSGLSHISTQSIKENM